MGKVSFPGDKSIAHRAAIIAACALGRTCIRNFPLNDDCGATISALRAMGARISAHRVKSLSGDTLRLTVRGGGPAGFHKPSREIFAGESGTTIRLLAGILAGQGFDSRLSAAASLSRRPMRRLTVPLRMMGADIRGRKIASQPADEYPPLKIRGRPLKGIFYTMPTASAQVKSALLLAGLYARGATTIIESFKTRDHTERMLKAFGARVRMSANTVTLLPGRELVSPGTIVVPGDISSSAFFIVAALIVPSSRLVIEDVSLNPGRIGILNALRRMGARIKIMRQSVSATGGEPRGTLLVSSSRLRGTRITEEDVPSLIDEVPLLMVAASCADSESSFEGLRELRVKETDRIASMSANLINMGVDVKIHSDRRQDAVIIAGRRPLRGAKVESFGDHRTAMSMVVAGMAAHGETVIDDVDCVGKSFPGFIDTVKMLTK